jgi:diguanylate cyclase (GGDEF)-like protein
MREGDIAARFGGDEFVFACFVDHAIQARAIGERLKVAIEDGFEYATHAVAMTASIGIAPPQSDDDTSALLRRADTAAYVAKHMGKARVECLQ